MTARFSGRARRGAFRALLVVLVVALAGCGGRAADPARGLVSPEEALRNRSRRAASISLTRTPHG